MFSSSLRTYETRGRSYISAAEPLARRTHVGDNTNPTQPNGGVYRSALSHWQVGNALPPPGTAWQVVTGRSCGGALAQLGFLMTRNEDSWPGADPKMIYAGKSWANIRDTLDQGTEELGDAHHWGSWTGRFRVSDLQDQQRTIPGPMSAVPRVTPIRFRCFCQRQSGTKHRGYVFFLPDVDHKGLSGMQVSVFEPKIDSGGGLTCSISRVRKVVRAPLRVRYPI